MKRADSKNYYAFLGISPHATEEEIKKAYHRKAQQLHPDKNPKKNTTRDFQFLQEAYSVLKNPMSRRNYDYSQPIYESRRSSAAPERERPFSPPPPDSRYSPRRHPKDPVRCGKCASISAQPRYIIFYQVKSFFSMSTKTPIEGIYCSKCACFTAVKASLITWLLGWWAFPQGIIWSVEALFTNLKGGKHPPDMNARILCQQAAYFKKSGKTELAKAILKDALYQARKFKIMLTYLSYQHPLSTDYQVQLKDFDIFYKELITLDSSIKIRRPKSLKTQWGLFNYVTLVQFIIMIFFLSRILSLFR